SCGFNKSINGLKRQFGAVAKYPKSVIPAKAGIQNINGINGFWIPAFAGMTENVISQQRHNVSFSW
ncbi:MAG: hypothetical protein ABIH71_05170, partial [Candidatus Omnitrophota bacterium]